MTLSEVLSRSLAAVTLRPEDEAAAALARRYADVLDSEPDALVKVGPLLLACLESLGMTAKGRAVVLGKGGQRGDGGGKQRSALDDLRAKREARARKNGT
ncbi:terminase small subunit [Amycolatopsis thermoflava]|uniref:terminase small subunit n=1 Tax=Amycolatopsis thermoflava TaxID=84480 RepID=UPI003EBAD9D4